MWWCVLAFFFFSFSGYVGFGSEALAPRNWGEIPKEMTCESQGPTNGNYLILFYTLFCN